MLRLISSGNEVAEALFDFQVQPYQLVGEGNEITHQLPEDAFHDPVFPTHYPGEGFVNLHFRASFEESVWLPIDVVQVDGGDTEETGELVGQVGLAGAAVADDQDSGHWMAVLSSLASTSSRWPLRIPKREPSWQREDVPRLPRGPVLIAWESYFGGAVGPNGSVSGSFSVVGEDREEGPPFQVFIESDGDPFVVIPDHMAVDGKVQLAVFSLDADECAAGEASG